MLFCYTAVGHLNTFLKASVETKKLNALDYPMCVTTTLGIDIFSICRHPRYISLHVYRRWVISWNSD